MSTDMDRREEESSISEQAAAWRDVLDRQDTRRVPEFWEWVTQSPVHVREALVMGLLQQTLQTLAQDNRMEIQVPAAGNVGDVVAFTPPPRAVHQKVASRPLGAALAIAACVVLGLAALLLFGSPNVKPTVQTYATEVGEQRYIRLTDGSLVVLDAQSSLRVELSAHERSFYLVGQALFNVAHDPSRPFRVHAASATVEAIGTEFNVRTENLTTVAVLDGVVRLSSQAVGRVPDQGTREPPGTPIQLTAGEAAGVDANGEFTDRTRVDRATITAWEQRRLVFSSAPLEEIVREFNRYNRKGHLRVEGRAALLRFGGVFDATDPSPLLLILAKNHDVVLERDGDEVVIRDRR